MQSSFDREPASGKPIHPNGALAIKIAVRGTVKMVWYSADLTSETGKWRPRFSVDEYRKKTGHTPVSAAHQLDEQFETEAEARERAKQAAIEFANGSK
jgi:hypothetical protein